MSSRFAALAIAADVPFRVKLHSIEGAAMILEGTEEQAYIDVLSDDSRDAVAAQQENSNRHLSAMRGVRLTSQQLEADAVEVLVKKTKGWLLCGADGKKIDVAFTEAAARELYSDPELAFIREQVQAASANRANFKRASPTKS